MMMERIDNEEQIDPESVARIQFFSTERNDDTNTWKEVWYESIRCNQLFAKQISKGEKFYVNEFSNDAWICPNISEINLLNNPFLFPTGKNFVAIVNDCDIATGIDE